MAAEAQDTAVTTDEDPVAATEEGTVSGAINVTHGDGIGAASDVSTDETADNTDTADKPTDVDDTTIPGTDGAADPIATTAPSSATDTACSG